MQSIAMITGPFSKQNVHTCDINDVLFTVGGSGLVSGESIHVFPLLLLFVKAQVRND